MARTAQIVVIERDEQIRSLIHSSVSNLPYAEVIASTDNLIYGYELVRQNRPQMVFIDIREDPRKTLEIIERIAIYFKETMIVVSGQVLTLDTLMLCMRAGAREYLRRPFEPSDILAILEKHKKALIVDPAGDTTGRILTVFSNKGGLGKTTIAVNMAIALSLAVQKPVALVDLNLHLGDISTFMDVTPKQTIVDIAKNIGRVDAAYLESSLAQYTLGQAKVFVLADPLLVEEAEDVSAEQINTVLTILKSTFQYVIVDTNTSFDNKTLTALDLADNILLVSMVNLPTIRSTQRVLSLFDRLGYDSEKIKLLVNRYVPDEEITLEDVEDTLEHPLFWKIPNNYMVVSNSINRGMPVAALDNGQALAQNFMELACKVSGVVPQHLMPPAPAKNGKEDKSKNGNKPVNLEKNGTAPPTTRESKSLLGGLFGKK